MERDKDQPGTGSPQSQEQRDNHWLLTKDGQPRPPDLGYTPKQTEDLLRLANERCPEQPFNGTAFSIQTNEGITERAVALLREMAVYAPAPGTIVSPTAVMGFGWRAKEILELIGEEVPEGRGAVTNIAASSLFTKNTESVTTNENLVREILRTLWRMPQTPLVDAYWHAISDLAVELYGYPAMHDFIYSKPRGDGDSRTDLIKSRSNELKKWLSDWPQYIMSMMVGLALNDENMAWALAYG